MLSHEKEIYEYEQTLLKLKENNQNNPIWSDAEIRKLEKKLSLLKDKVYSGLTSWQRVEICRHPDRPRAIDYIQNICDSFTEIFGDRLYGDDRAMITGFGNIQGEKFVILAQEKGCNTESRVYRNFGMSYPEGYRKALRAMQLAEKFHLPVLSLIDTPGAYPALAAEERGQGWAIAKNLFTMSRLQTPIIVVLIGEGCSGGAIGIGIGDAVAMLEHAYYSVISPEGCASILWKDTKKKEDAAEVLKIHAEDLLSLGVIDDMIQEPQGGAHLDPTKVYINLEDYLLKKLSDLKNIPIASLLEIRYKKFRKMGMFDTIAKD